MCNPPTQVAKLTPTLGELSIHRLQKETLDTKNREVSRMFRRFSGHISHQVGPSSSHISWICPQTLPETNCETCAVRGPTLWPRLPSCTVHFGSDASFLQRLYLRGLMAKCCCCEPTCNLRLETVQMKLSQAPCYC